MSATFPAKQEVNNGGCRHGAIVKCKLCSHDGCGKYVQKNGVRTVLILLEESIPSLFESIGDFEKGSSLSQDLTQRLQVVPNFQR
jgi:hypothetical protein